MKELLKISFVFILMGAFFACNKPEPPTYVDMVTAVKLAGTKGTFIQDDGTILTVVEGLSYVPQVDSQRLIVYYNYITEDKVNKKADIRLLDGGEVLTKKVFPVKTQAQMDSIGADPVHVREMWVAQGFLNVHFAYWYAGLTHYINLTDDQITPRITRDTLYLEFRHHNRSDGKARYGDNYASFRLSDYKRPGQDSLILAVKIKNYVRDFYADPQALSKEDKTVYRTYKWKDPLHTSGYGRVALDMASSVQ